MNIHTTPQKSGHKAQATVEFAIVLPVLLLVIFAVIEFGRLLVAYVVTVTASREAARYGSAVGAGPGGIPRYVDCDGMRAAGVRFGWLAGIQASDIQIDYIAPNETVGGTHAHSCPASGPNRDVRVTLGYRVEVRVTGHFEPIVPMVPIRIRDIESVTRRTVVMNIPVGIPIVPPAPPPPGEISQSKMTFEEGSSEFIDESTPYRVINMVLSEPPSHPVMAELIYSGTAINGEDYFGPTSVNFGLSTTQSITLTIVDDTIDEDDETISIQIGIVYNAFPDPEGITTHDTGIIDNEDAPLVRFVPNSQTVTEDVGVVGDQFFVELSHASELEIQVEIALITTTAVSGSDFNTLSPSPLVFPPGGPTVGTVSLPWTVEIINDTTYEHPENFRYEILSATNATVNMSANILDITIQDDYDNPPTVTFAIPNIMAGTETTGFPNPVRIELSAISGRDTVVPFTIGGTATINQDYTISHNGSITIPAGQPYAEIVLVILPDSDDNEPEETIILTIGNPTNAVKGDPSVFTATIANRLVRFRQVVTSYGEATPNTRAFIEVFTTSAAPPGGITVPLILSGRPTRSTDGGLTGDYLLHYPNYNDMLLYIPPGQNSVFVDLTILDDALYEGAEELILTLGEAIVNGGRGYPYIHRMTIIDNDNVPTLNFDAPLTALRAENNTSPVNIVARLSAVAGIPVTATVFTGASTASLGADFTILPSTLIIPEGATTASIQVTVLNDNIDENDETVVVNLVNVINANPGTLTHTTTITDDDAEPRLTFTAPSVTCEEGAGCLELPTLQLVDPVTGLPVVSGKIVQATLSLAGSTATLNVDYTINVNIAIPAGMNNFQIPITIIDDEFPEVEETINLALTNYVNASPGARPSHIVYIRGNDEGLCNSLYQLVVNMPVPYKVGATSYYYIWAYINNGSGDLVSIAAFQLNWEFTPQNGTPTLRLFRALNGNSQIWPQTTTYLSSPAIVSSNWNTGGNRILAPGTLNNPGRTDLYYHLQVDNGAIRAMIFRYLKITLSNGCTPSQNTITP